MKEERKYYLDWLRVIVVLLLIPHHAALTFSHIGNGYVYTKEVVDSLYYIIQSDFLNLWFMKLLFFISGMSAYLALKKRSPSEFLKERFTKLFIPAAFVTLLLGPLTVWIVAYSGNHFSDSFPMFYPVYFRSIAKYLGWAHMWFCVYLFVFSIISLPLFTFLKKRPKTMKLTHMVLETKHNFLIPMLLIIIFEVLLRPLYPGLQILINDWANFTVYLSFFLFGYIMGQSDDLLTTIKQHRRKTSILAITATILYITLNRSAYFQSDLYIRKVILNSLSAVAAYSWVMFSLGFGGQYMNKKSPILNYLSQSAFALYIFHYMILSILNLYLIRTSLNHYVIFVITCLTTYLIFLIFYELVIKKVQVLRFICGLKIEKKIRKSSLGTFYRERTKCTAR